MPIVVVHCSMKGRAERGKGEDGVVGHADDGGEGESERLSGERPENVTVTMRRSPSRSCHCRLPGTACTVTSRL